MIDLGDLLQKEKATEPERNYSGASVVESEDLSHRPSAEFLEKLERAYQIEP